MLQFEKLTQVGCEPEVSARNFMTDPQVREPFDESRLGNGRSDRYHVRAFASLPSR
jgi:hypothetical protein